MTSTMLQFGTRDSALAWAASFSLKLAKRSAESGLLLSLTPTCIEVFGAPSFDAFPSLSTSESSRKRSRSSRSFTVAAPQPPGRCAHNKRLVRMPLRATEQPLR